VFYHFAWDYTSRDFRNNPILQNHNINNTLLALQLAKRLGCKKFVGAGSQAEYGYNNEIICPDTSVNPFTAYGIAKYAAGKMSEILSNTYEMEHVWVRIFSVYGKNDNEGTLISYLIDSLSKNLKPSLSKAENLWDYLYEDDAGRAFFLIGRFSTGNKVYCLASGRSYKLFEYINIVRDIVNPVGDLGFGEINVPKNHVISRTVSIADLTKDTSFSPEIDFEEGIRRMLSK
jgi:nucleoside-diphosphate-sugar epimerase